MVVYYVYFPPYSPELIPIEQFWSIIEHKVRRSIFEDKEDLFTRNSEAYSNAPSPDRK